MESPGVPSPSPPPGIRVGVPAGLFLAAFFCFSPALGGEFLNWDDNLVLVEHESWRGLGGDEVRWAFRTFHAGHYHPLTWLSFGLDYELWGMNPRGFHFVNLLLHATTAVLVYGVFLFLLDGSGRSRLAAAAGALFFAIHPLRVESVAWITERRDVLSGCLLLGAVLAYLRWTRDGGKGWYGLALGAFALSLLSKAWGIALPAVLLVLDIHPLRRFVAGRRAAVLLEKAPFAVLAAAAAVLAWIAQKRIGAMNLIEGHTLVDRAIQSAYGLSFYVAKTLLPVAQNPLYALKPSFNPFEARYLVGALAAGAATAAVILLRKRRPELLAAWAVFVVSVAPVLGLAQAGPQLVAERYTYLSCIPIAALGAAALSRTGARAAWIAAGVGIAAFGFQTWRYCHVWKDSVTLWTRAVARDSGNTLAWYNLGSAKLDRGRAEEAFDDLSRAIDLDPRHARAHLNRGVARMGRDPEGAIADFDAAIRILPDFADALVNRGWARFGQGDSDRALADLDSAIEVQPDHYKGRLMRAVVRMERDEGDQAKQDIESALRLKPFDPDAWYVRAQLRDREGDLDGAISDYARALHLGGFAWDPRKRSHAEELLARARRRKAGP